MRRVVVAAGLASALVSAPATASARDYPWAKRVSSTTSYAKARSGRVAFAVVDPSGHVRGYHIHEQHRSASVVKAMLLVSYLRRSDVRGRSLGAGDKRLLSPMITRSDNSGATRVRKIVGNAGLAKLARRAGMKDFATDPAWGSTRISAFDQARFLFYFDAYVPPRHRAYARALLAGVIAPQRWGLARAVPPGWQIFFKGGWRPLNGRNLINQSAAFEKGSTRIGLAVLTDGNPSYAYGHETLRGVGVRLLARIDDFEAQL